MGMGYYLGEKLPWDKYDMDVRVVRNYIKRSFPEFLREYNIISNVKWWMFDNFIEEFMTNMRIRYLKFLSRSLLYWDF